MSARARAVLVVEDDPSVRELVRMVVESEFGLLVLVAEDGQDALRVLAEQLPALIVTDVQMPRLNGVELVQQLRACPATRAIPVVVVAASRASREAAMGAGGNGYLDKPFDVDALIRMVQEHLPAEYTGLAS